MSLLFQVREEVHCPSGVCVACTNSVLAANEFKTLTESSQKLWHQAISSLDELPQVVAPVKSVFAVLKPDLTLKTVYNCTEREFKAILNGTTCESKPIKSRLEKKNRKKKVKISKYGLSCTCLDCGKAFANPQLLNVHLQNSGEKEACLSCGDVIQKGNDMKVHMWVVHNKRVCLCAECPRTFSDEAELQAHEKKAHKPGALTCAVCGRTFSRSSALDIHAQMHAVRTCRTCGTQFTTRACYREHRAQCEPDAKPDMTYMTRNRRANVRDPATYTCDYCGKTYLSRPQLKNHIIWIHMDVRPHQCQWCGKRFYTPARLAEHTVVHTRVRNFGCDICGAKLVTKAAAIYHRRRHTGEKPYKCDYCEESFISASRRTEHTKRRHGKGLRCQCVLCPANFIKGRELQRHMEKAHPNTLEALAKLG